MAKLLTCQNSLTFSFFLKFSDFSLTILTLFYFPWFTWFPGEWPSCTTNSRAVKVRTSFGTQYFLYIFTCTLVKSTLLRSVHIWLICCGFWRTARAAWARWFNEVYRRKVWENALTAATLTFKISCGISVILLISQFSRLFAKFRIIWVKPPTKKDST